VLKSLTENFTINAKILTLVEKLTDARERHIQDYDAALDVYWDMLENRLAILTENARTRITPEDGFRLTLKPPVNVVEYFDDYLEMLRLAMEAGDQIMVLDTYKYNAFVKGQFDEMETANVSNAFYLARVRK